MVSQKSRNKYWKMIMTILIEMIVVVWDRRKSDKIVLERKLYTSWWLSSCYLLSGSFLPWDKIVSTWGKLSLSWVKIILQWTHFLQVTVTNPVLFIFWLASTCFPKCKGSEWNSPAHCAVKYIMIYRRWKWLWWFEEKRYCTIASEKEMALANGKLFPWNVFQMGVHGFLSLTLAYLVDLWLCD